MPELVSTIITGAATAITAIGGPLLGGLLKNRQDARLRQSIRQNKELAAELRSSGGELTSRATDLEDLAGEQIAVLIHRERRRLNRRYDWSSLGVVIFLLAVGTPLLVALWQAHHWWWTFLFYLLAIFLGAMTAVGLNSTFRPEDKSAKEEATK